MDHHDSPARGLADAAAKAAPGRLSRHRSEGSRFPPGRSGRRGSPAAGDAGAVGRRADGAHRASGYGGSVPETTHAALSDRADADLCPDRAAAAGVGRRHRTLPGALPAEAEKNSAEKRFLMYFSPRTRFYRLE